MLCPFPSDGAVGTPSLQDYCRNRDTSRAHDDSPAARRTPRHAVTRFRCMSGSLGGNAAVFGPTRPLRPPRLPYPRAVYQSPSRRQPKTRTAAKKSGFASAAGPPAVPSTTMAARRLAAPQNHIETLAPRRETRFIVTLAACPPVLLGECDRLADRSLLKAGTRLRWAGRDRSAESGGRSGASTGVAGGGVRGCPSGVAGRPGDSPQFP